MKNMMAAIGPPFGACSPNLPCKHFRSDNNMVQNVHRSEAKIIWQIFAVEDGGWRMERVDGPRHERESRLAY